MHMRRIRRAAIVSGAAALLVAGPTAAIADDGQGLDQLRDAFESEDSSPFDDLGDGADGGDDAPDGLGDGDAQDADPPEGLGGDDTDDTDDGEAGVDEDDAAESDPLGALEQDEGGSDDAPTDPLVEGMQTFCDEFPLFAEDPEAREQCEEFVETFAGDESDDGPGEVDDGDDGDAPTDPLVEGMQTFCDEFPLFAEDPEAREQCEEFVETFAGDDPAGEDDPDSDDPGESGDPAPGDGGDAGGEEVLGESAAQGGDGGALATTGTGAAAASAAGLGLMGLGGTLLRRFRGGTDEA